MNTSTMPCSCGLQHPAGFVCERALSGLDQTDFEKACACGGHVHEHARDPEPGPGHEPAAGGCCGHDQAAPQPVDLASLGAASETRAVYRIMNMDCPMEEALIRKKLGSLKGVRNMEFNLMQRLLSVEHDLPSTESIVAALKSIDMTPEVLEAGPAERTNQTSLVPAARIPWLKLAVGGLFAALSEASELLLEWNVNPFGLALADWLPLVFAVLAIAFAGLSTYKKGWLAIKNFNLNINALMSVAATGAVLIGHYPEAAMVMVLFTLSEAIEAKALDRARKAIKDLLALAPERATLQGPDGAWLEVDVRDIPLGSRLRVKPGERIALDGLVLQGHSSINQAPITGESLPVEKNPGDLVYAGTINESGSFEFEVTATASDSTLARIIHAVEEAQGSRAPMQRFVDQFAKYYTPAVFLTAILAALIPPLFLGAAWAASVYTGLVILVIGCPCALVISTPVSIVSGMAAATRSGILVKGGMFLEQGRLLKWLALDKTGTITHGRPRQTDFVELAAPAELADLGEGRTTLIAASLAARSDHPVSRAVAESALAQGVSPLQVDDFAAIPGRGVSGFIDGQKWYLGNHRLVEDLAKCSPALEERIFELEGSGKTVVALVGASGVQGLFAVADTIRESSLEAIGELKKLGVKTMMLTGDNEHTARAIAGQVGVDAYQGNLLPADKLRVIEQLARELPEKNGKVGMVGDGINDAPALARADIGFAMAGNGTDTAIETADVALMDDDLRKIPRFIRLSKSTYAILVQNISLALGVKALFLGLAFMNLATMWMAVFADVGTALLVVANGLRAMRK